MEKGSHHERPPRMRAVTFLSPRSNGIRFILIAAVLILGALWMLDPGRQWAVHRPDGEPLEEKKVPLEAHIMSKCPDARDCLLYLVLPTMERASDKVDFTLSYIGTPTDSDDGVACKHGPTECLGNIIELCAARLYPDPKLYLGFTMCLTNQYAKIPEKDLVQNCALEHGMSFDKINECASDESGLGMGMLRDSVTRSMDANVTISCTIRLNEKVRCIRDGGQWKNCEDGSSVKSLVKDIETLWKKENTVRQSG